MARLYTNENIPLQVVNALRAFGHDVLTTHESGNANQAIPDEQVLTFSSAQDRILITFNRKHFIRLHQQKFDPSGIVVCTLDTDFVGLAERIHHALLDSPTMTGVLLRVNRPNK